MNAELCSEAKRPYRHFPDGAEILQVVFKRYKATFQGGTGCIFQKSLFSNHPNEQSVFHFKWLFNLYLNNVQWPNGIVHYGVSYEYQFLTIKTALSNSFALRTTNKDGKVLFCQRAISERRGTREVRPISDTLATLVPTWWPELVLTTCLGSEQVSLRLSDGSGDHETRWNVITGLDTSVGRINPFMPVGSFMTQKEDSDISSGWGFTTLRQTHVCISLTTYVCRHASGR